MTRWSRHAGKEHRKQNMRTRQLTTDRRQHAQMPFFAAGGQEMLRQAVNNFFEKSLGVPLDLTHPLWQKTGDMSSIRQKQK